MKISHLLIFALLLAPFFLSAQSGQVLFTVDDNSYYTDEFVRVYNKNLELVKDDSQKDLDKYLDLFVGYKLKVAKANKLGLQNNIKYQNELKSYRGQLAKNYVNDSKVTNELVEEAYDRVNKEVRASHILILLDEEASPEDTLKAFHKITKVKGLLAAGEDFEKVAMEYSEDPSVKDNKGDLGYFSAFRMVYPFENAAFNTKVGQVSNFFKTKFGYHIVKVTDSRKNRGEVTVAHIMILKPEKEELQEKSKVTIDEIYQKIIQGESFENLANQFSEDKSTAGKGGLLQRFGSGQLASEEFEKVAFSLQDKEQISKPFQSQFGWHIVKLIEKHPVLSMEEMRTELENKVKKDERSLLIKNSLALKLRSKFKFTKNDKLFKKIKKEVTNDFYSHSWKDPENKDELSGELVFIDGNKKLDASLFVNYISNQQKGVHKIKPIGKLVDNLFEKWMDEQLSQYNDDNLENEFPEFKNVVEEYRDGLLLFDLMEKEIWEKAKMDTIGLNKFYQENAKKYMWTKRYDVDVFSSTNQKYISKTQSYLKKGKSIEYIKSKLNKDGVVNVLEKSGLFEEDHDVLTKYTNLSLGVSSIVEKENYFFVVNVKEIKPAQVKEMNECKGKLINDYQQYLENNWVGDLKNEFTVKIDKKKFEEVKKQISN